MNEKNEVCKSFLIKISIMTVIRLGYQFYNSMLTVEQDCIVFDIRLYIYILIIYTYIYNDHVDTLMRWQSVIMLILGHFVIAISFLFFFCLFSYIEISFCVRYMNLVPSICIDILFIGITTTFLLGIIYILSSE